MERNIASSLSHVTHLADIVKPDEPDRLWSGIDVPVSGTQTAHKKTLLSTIIRNREKIPVKKVGWNGFQFVNMPSMDSTSSWAPQG